MRVIPTVVLPHGEKELLRLLIYALTRLSLKGKVSDIIREMPFLWLEVDDPPGRDSLRGYIESNSIALLSNYNPNGNRPAIQ